jgi:hypothetical protein
LDNEFYLHEYMTRFLNTFFTLIASK